MAKITCKSILNPNSIANSDNIEWVNIPNNYFVLFNIDTEIGIVAKTKEDGICIFKHIPIGRYEIVESWRVEEVIDYEVTFNNAIKMSRPIAKDPR